MFPFRLILGAILAVSILPAQAVERFVSAREAVRLDPQQCYRVRDLFLEREDVRFYFTDGLLIFADSLNGRDVGAFFIAEEPTDSAEVLVIPPSAQERYSLSSFTGEGVLNRTFNHSVLLFTDDTADKLREGILQRGALEPEIEHGERLSRRWTPVFRNLLDAASTRIATDVLSDIALTDGLFAAAVGGGVAGRFDVIVEPRAEIEQISIGQSVRRDGALFHEVWSRFPARSIRTGKGEPVGFGGRVRSYDLDVTLDDDLYVTVSARAEFEIDQVGRRTFPFSLAPLLEVTEVLVDGVPAEFLYDATRSASNSPDSLNTALVVLPEARAVGDVLNLEFRYRGAVVEHTDNDVYLVGSRTSWYPRASFERANYRLTFHFPAAFELRATGERIETSTDGDRKTAVFETVRPINLAGFNLGFYESEVRNVAGYRLEILANRELESRLQESVSVAPAPPPAPLSPGRRTPLRMDAPLPMTSEESSRPTDQIEAVADEVARSFEYFLQQFGPPIARDIAVTPIPDGYGQGFPGLVYAPTLSYLDPAKPPLSLMRPYERAFYKEALFPHEISHQWWGNLVSVDNAADSWIVEALATYSALMFLEDTVGTDTPKRFLSYYQSNLRSLTDAGDPVESAGPLVLGDRLTSSRFPNALAAIVYGKGAWVMHMLRAELGRERFSEFLTNLTSEFSDTLLTTDTFRESAARYLPDDADDRHLIDFFDQWVYGTGVPHLSVNWSATENGIEGRITQWDVPDHFAVPLTMDVATASGTVRHKVMTDGSVTEFSFAAAGPVLGVVLDPDQVLLAEID